MKSYPFGLDISDHSVELVALSKMKGGVGVTAVGRAEIPPGLIRRGVIQETERLTAVLNRFFDSVFGSKRGRLRAAVALPDTQVYAKVFTLPANLNSDLAAKAAAIEAADIFPLPLGDIVSDTVVLGRRPDHQDMLYAAAERQTVAGYADLLRRVGVEPICFEPESLAVARILTGREAAAEPVLIADIGAETTLLTVYDQGGPRFSTSIAWGGDNLTAAVENQLNVPLDKAENFKRRAGFDPMAETGRVFLILQKPTTEIIGEIGKTLAYYEKKTGRRPAKIILAGGTSLVPAIAEYVGSNFPQADVVLGEPFRGLIADRLPQAQDLKTNAILYATAAGLALRAGGFAAGPVVDLLPNRRGRGRGGANAVLGAAQSAGLALISMVRRKQVTPIQAARAVPVEPVQVEPTAQAQPAVQPEPVQPEAVAEIKPQPQPVKRRRAAHKKEPAVEEAEIREPAAEPPVSAVPVRAGAVPSAPVASEVAPVETMAAVEAEPPVEDEEEIDASGRGVGYLLDSTRYDLDKKTRPKPAAPPVSSAASRSGSKVLWVDSIIAGNKTVAPPPDETPEPDEPIVSVPPSAKPRLLPWFLLALILVIAAAVGVYMFAGKTGLISGSLLDRVTGIFHSASPTSPAAVPAADVNAEPEAAAVPASLAMTVLISKEKQAASPDRPWLASRVIETEVSASDSFPATGEVAAASPGVAAGQLKIIDKTAQGYTFVATTRFLTKDGVLFRLKQATVIPANGSVEAAVYADKAGPDGDIGPSSFTIPGLPADLRTKVYAESSAAMSGGASTAKGVTADDLVKAKAALLDKLKTEAAADMKAMTAEGELILPELVTSQEVSVKSLAAGASAASFTMTLTVRFRALVVPQAGLDALLLEKLKTSLPVGQNLADYELGQAQYAVEAYDTEQELAEVRVEAPVLKQ